MKIKKLNRTFSGTINIGLQKNYTGVNFTKQNYLDFIKNWQFKRKSEGKTILFPGVYEFDFISGELCEKHLAIKFINYTHPIITSKKFKKIIKKLAIKLAEHFEQNRILIEFSDGNYILEAAEDVDEKGLLKK